MLDDQWALAQAGAAPLDSYLALASTMGGVRNPRAWDQITGVLGRLESYQRGAPGHAAFTAYARDLVRPLAQGLGWDARPEDTPAVQKLRRTVLGQLGAWGDPATVAEARKRFAAFLADRNAIAPDDQSMVMGIIASSATPAEFEQLHAIAQGATDEAALRRYYEALTLVRDPAQAAKVGAILVSDEIPKQAGTARLPLLARMVDAHPQLAWDLFKQNADALLAPYAPFELTFLSQEAPDLFWRAAPPDQLEAWFRQRVPANMAPDLARGMETARFRHAEAAAMRKAADAVVSAQGPVR